MSMNPPRSAPHPFFVFRSLTWFSGTSGSPFHHVSSLKTLTNPAGHAFEHGRFDSFPKPPPPSTTMSHRRKSPSRRNDPFGTGIHRGKITPGTECDRHPHADFIFEIANAHWVISSGARPPVARSIPKRLATMQAKDHFAKVRVSPLLPEALPGKHRFQIPSGGTGIASVALSPPRNRAH